MILSVSRRTDIPAFYTPWFFERLKQGFVLVRNPINPRQISRIALSPDVVDCIVFWTKNPHEILQKLDSLKPFMYYFMITINPYGSDIECNLPPKKYIVDDFIRLSEKIGKERVIWRYDPIILTEKINIGWHKKYFDEIAKRLCGYTEKCVISFLDLYKTTQRGMKDFGCTPIDEKTMRTVAENIAHSAEKYGILVQTCCESIDLYNLGITHGSCIDAKLIEKLTGKKLAAKNDKNQRETCGCVESVDIGAYNTCANGCIYCYANHSAAAVLHNTAAHNPHSPLLCGKVLPEDKITQRPVRSLAKETDCGQIRFF
jgi:hypothetical protein